LAINYSITVYYGSYLSLYLSQLYIYRSVDIQSHSSIPYDYSPWIYQNPLEEYSKVKAKEYSYKINSFVFTSAITSASFLASVGSSSEWITN
jgi:hypothetical protein